MSDFQPLFDLSAESAEFIPLEFGVVSEFEPMELMSSAAGGQEFEPTTTSLDPSPDAQLGDGSEALADGSDPTSQSTIEGEESNEAGAEQEVSSDGTDRSLAPEEGEVAADAGEASEAEEAGEPEIDPAIRAIEAAAQKAGYESGMMRGKAEIAERLKEVEDILAQVEGLRSEFFARSVQDVGRTVTKVAEQVIRRELSVSPGDIEGLVRGILADVQSDDDFVIRVSEADAATLRESHSSLLELVGRDGGLRIEVDSRLMAGGTVVETSYGKIDASIEQQLQAFAAGVEAWVTAEVEASDD